MNKFIFGAASAVLVCAGGKALSSYAEKRPELKSIKEKIVRAKSNLAADCKEIAGAVVAAFRGQNSACSAQMTDGC